MKISVKRVYDEPRLSDGVRILVDRLWPRGLSKESAEIDLWIKSIAPSDDLRKWYQHDHRKWEEFKKRYFAELNSNKDAVNELAEYIKKGKVILLYSSKETQFNNAVALKEYMEGISK